MAPELKMVLNRNGRSSSYHHMIQDKFGGKKEDSEEEEEMPLAKAICMLMLRTPK